MSHYTDRPTQRNKYPYHLYLICMSSAMFSWCEISSRPLFTTHTEIWPVGAWKSSKKFTTKKNLIRTCDALRRHTSTTRTRRLPTDPMTNTSHWTAAITYVDHSYSTTPTDRQQQKLRMSAATFMTQHPGCWVGHSCDISPDSVISTSQRLLVHRNSTITRAVYSIHYDLLRLV